MLFETQFVMAKEGLDGVYQRQPESQHSADPFTRVWYRYELVSITLFAAIGTAALVGLALALIDPVFVIRPGDAQTYVELARAPFEAVSAPFTYRILTPLLVYLLPTSAVAGFTIVNLTGIVATTVVFYYYLREFGLSLGVRIAGVAMLLLSPMLAYTVINIGLTDVLGFLFLALCLYAAKTDHHLLFASSLFVGVLARETVLLAVPVYLLYVWWKGEPSEITKVLADTVPAAAAFWYVRLVYGLEGYLTIESVMQTISAHMTKLETSLFYLPYEIYSVFGTFWLVAVLAARRIDDTFLKAGLYVFPLVFLQPLIARDIARVLFIGFPIVIPASLVLVSQEGLLSGRWKQAIVAVSGVSVVAGLIGVVFVLPALAEFIVSIDVGELQYLAVTKIAHEAVIVLAVGYCLWNRPTARSDSDTATD